ncbi:MAG: TlpA family protein disulfide reductase [Bryobacteraceae bacterium]|nr:TlpA family protein disulfide reductase [Bryobacteraceae bacterium]
MRMSKWAALALVWILAAGAAAQIPRRAPDYAVQLLDGTKAPLASHLGKVVVLAFVNTDCPHCREACGLMQKLQNEYGPRGVQMLAVAFDQRARQDLPQFIQRSGAKFPIGYDTPMALLRFLERPPAAVYVPILVFLDRAGFLRGTYLGDSEFVAKDLEKNLRGMIEKLASEKPGGRRGLRF